MLRAIDREILVGQLDSVFIKDSDYFRLDRPVLTSIAVVELVSLSADRLQVFINVIDAAGCVHPAGVFIESLIDEELSPRHGAVRIQAFVADHLGLRSEVKRRMRIDQKQRTMRGRI